MHLRCDRGFSVGEALLRVGVGIAARVGVGTAARVGVVAECDIMVPLGPPGCDPGQISRFQ